jgi:hypothetical protein
MRARVLAGALVLLPHLAWAAGSSLGAHQAQAAACRSALARSASGRPDVGARILAATRAEECLVQADDSMLPLLSRAAGEDADVPNAVQTYRDASAAFCRLLAEKSGDADAPAARAQCAANRESELARLIDAYATGGKPPAAIATGIGECDGPFHAKRSDPSAWEALTTCALDRVKAKADDLVPKSAEGDPLGTLGHTREHVTLLLGGSVSAGNGICDLFAPAVRARCHAEVAANVAKAVVAVAP